MLEILNFDHILITVPPATSEAARDFYTKKLMLKEIPGEHPKGAIWIKLGNYEIHIREEEGHQSNSARHAAFAVKNLEEVKAFLVKKEIKISYSTKIEGRERLFFYDPWGNRFELIEYEG